MTEDGQHILEEALRLSPAERAEVAVELIASLDGDSDPDAEQAWAQEVERRAQLAHAGTTEGTDWEVVRDRLRRRLEGS